jgi:hypothetical protein
MRGFHRSPAGCLAATGSLQRSATAHAAYCDCICPLSTGGLDSPPDSRPAPGRAAAGSPPTVTRTWPRDLPDTVGGPRLARSVSCHAVQQAMKGSSSCPPPCPRIPRPGSLDFCHACREPPLAALGFVLAAAGGVAVDGFLTPIGRSLEPQRCSQPHLGPRCGVSLRDLQSCLQRVFIVGRGRLLRRGVRGWPARSRWRVEGSSVAW